MRRSLLVFGMLMLLASPGRSQWQSMVTGNELAGWRTLGGEATYSADDGTVIGTSAPNTPNSFLVTAETYGDFVFECEFKVDDGLNSGIQFRSQSRPDFNRGRVHGYQAEIDTAERAWTGGVYDEARRGWIYPVSYNPPARSLFKPGEWNAMRIECVGNSLRTWVNGQPVAHVIDDVDASGFIGLQVHSIGNNVALEGKQVRWRNLRIRTDVSAPTLADDVFVRSTLVNQLSDAEVAQGWQLLFDGETTTGWRGWRQSGFPEGGWRVENGELVVTGLEGGGDIVTEDSYSAFAFDFEFLPTRGSNSGIKYFVTEQYLETGSSESAIGLEYQILDDERHPDATQGRDGNRTMASLYDMIASRKRSNTRDVPRHIDDWNHGRVVVYPDHRVEHWLNGFNVVDYVRKSEAFLDLVAQSKYKVWDGFGLWDEGRLLLQDHGDEVRFRSLKVRTLE